MLAVGVDGFAHLVVFRAVHQMRGLDNEVLDAVCDCALKGLLHVVDLLAVTRLNVVDDDLRGKGTTDGPVGVGFLQGVLDGLDVGHAAGVEGRAEGDDQQLVFADVILVSGIVQRSVAGVKAEVVGAGFLALDEFLLRIGQSVPCSLGGFTLGVGLLGAGLDIDGVDHGCNLVGRLLIELLLRGGSSSAGAFVSASVGSVVSGAAGGALVSAGFVSDGASTLLQAESVLSSIRAASTSARIFFIGVLPLFKIVLKEYKKRLRFRSRSP